MMTEAPGVVDAITPGDWLPPEALTAWRHAAWYLHRRATAPASQRELARRFLLQHAIVGGRERRQ